MKRFLFPALFLLLLTQTFAQQKVREVLIMQHSHLDVGFTHLQPVAMELQKDFINQALDMLDRTASYPEDSRPRWTCEVTEPVMQWLEDASAADKKKFGEYLRQGRIVISALEYNTTPLAGSEGLARQLYDAAELSKRFGVKVNTANLHDATGLPWPVVDLLKDAGVEMLSMAINLHLSGTPKPRPAVYRWQSPAGRELLVMNGEHYSMFDQWTNDHTGNLDTIQAGLDRYLSYVATQNYPYDFVYLTATCAPYAYDNSPPNIDLPEVVRRWNAEGRQPRLRFVTPQELLERIKKIPYESIPVVKGDWTDFWNFGASSSAAETRISLNTAANMNVIDLLASFGNSYRQLDGIRKKIWDDINFYDEHTWGAYNPLEIHHPFPTAQWYMKAFPAYEGMALSKFALTRYLQELAGNAQTYYGVEGIMLLNTTGKTMKVYPRVPADWFLPGKRIELAMMGGPAFERSPETGLFYGPVELKPYSWTKVPLGQLREAKPEKAIITGKDYIETAFYRLAFNPETGKITSLYDKTSKREVLDAANAYGFFQFVHEKPDPAVDSMRTAFHVRRIENERIGLTGWQTGWKAAYSTLTAPECRIESDTFTATLVINAKAEGTDGIEQRIILYADSPVIDLTADFVKTENVMPESIYFVFPLNMEAGWKGWFDTGDIPVELDREQLAGSCHDWVTVSSFAGIYNKDKGATLYCPDAPMVMFGGFNFGRNQATIRREKNPMLLAWATNNYWETNFRGSQPGRIQLRYAFRPQGAFDAAAIANEAQSVVNPVIIHPVADCQSLSSGEFIKLNSDGVRITWTKVAEDGKGRIIRLVNLREEPVETSLEQSGIPVTGAWKCSTAEEKKEKLATDGSLIKIQLQPREITSVRIE